MNGQRFSRTGRFRLIAALLNRPGALIVDDDGLRIEPLFGGERGVQRWAWSDIRRAELEVGQGVVRMLRQGGLFPHHMIDTQLGVRAQLVLVRQNGEAQRIRLADYGRPREIAAALSRHRVLDAKPWQTVEQMPPRRNGVILAGWVFMLLCIVLLLVASFLREGWAGLHLPLLVLGLPFLVARVVYRRRRPAVVDGEGIRFFEAGFINVARWHLLVWSDILRIEPEYWGNVPTLSISTTNLRRFRVAAADLGWPAEMPARLGSYLAPAAFAAPASGQLPLSHAEIAQRSEDLLRLAMILMFGAPIVAGLAFMPFSSNWHVPSGPGLLSLTVTVLLGCAFTVYWLGRAGVHMRPFGSLATALLLGAGLWNFVVQTVDPLMLQAGWHRVETVELRFVAAEHSRQVWMLDGRKVRVDGNWSGFAAPPEDSRWRLTVWRGPFGALVIPPEAFRAAQRVE